MKYKFEKNRVKNLFLSAVLGALTLFAFGCVPPEMANTNSNVDANAANTNTNTAPIETGKFEEADFKMPVTMPVLDAMFTDEEFTNQLKSEVQLSDEEIEKIKKAAREAVEKLGDIDEESDSRSTRAAMERADSQIREILGDEKTAKLFEVVRKRWSGGDTDQANNSGGNISGEINKIPDDTRIVVNAPAYRMDLFQDGKLMKSYKIGIGYPEFPLPSGMRQAKTIIFNPTWTPPDEPWVKGDIEAGKTVEAGSKKNPLGPIKIPIGLPSLIHGGKSAAKLGNFASHGCVGLTSPQIQDFTLNLAKISGMDLTKKEIADYEKEKTATKNVDLKKTIPVELRYETIVVEDGKLYIYRDVYERGTNTEENLRRVLDSYGVSLDDLDEKEREDILKGLDQMAYNAKGKSINDGASNSNTANSKTDKNMNSKTEKDSSKTEKDNSKNANSKKDDDAEVTRSVKGKKQVSFEIKELKGKGYPSPVDMSQK